jgi:hypothetical protein
MRKTFALIVAAAFVATLPTVASAKKRHRHHRAAAVQPVNADASGSHFVFDALHQIFVPLEVTLAPRAN